jgi:Spy/CpxP family protein refolding chaperone
LAQSNQPQANPPAAAQPQAELQNRLQQVMQQLQQLRQQRQQETQELQRQLQQMRQDQQQMRQRLAPALNQPAERPQPQPPASLDRALGGLPGRWWERPGVVQRLALTSDQQKKMDDVFQQSRLKLIDLNAAAQKEELVMEPLAAADQPDETKIVAQLDKVAQARAEIEKANVRMVLGIRRILTQDQWNKLKTETAGAQTAPASTRPPL